jgi:thiamine biosynthesis lipoprotein
MRPDRPADALRFSHEAMASVFEVLCVHEDARYARQAAEEAFRLVDRLEQDLSRFVANSDVSRVNALGPGEGTRVGPSTLECLELARRLHEATAGAFDVALGTGLDSLDLDPDGFAVHAAREGVQIDLGGIGKGYAVDAAADLLEEWEVRHALVHGGFSSVRALDPPPDRDGWPLTLSAPGGGPVLARVSARRIALSASGTQKGAHIRDPRTGEAVRDRAVWVAVSPAAGAAAGWPDAERWPATVAEGLSTALMVLSVEEATLLCRTGPGLEAWLFREPAPGATPELLHLAAAESDGSGRDPRKRDNDAHDTE